MRLCNQLPPEAKAIRLKWRPVDGASENNAAHNEDSFSPLQRAQLQPDALRLGRFARILFLTALVIAVLSADIITAQDAPSSWCVSVWYPSSDDPTGSDSISSNLDVIDLVNPFWYTLLPDGTVGLQPGAEDAEQLAAWREAGLVIVPSILSTSWAPLDTDEMRDFHIQQIIDLVERFDYDGLDIDYEELALSTRDAFSIFIERLADELHARGRLLSIAVHAKTDDAGNREGTAAQDWARLADAVDVFAIMTYDYTSRRASPGPIAPLEWTLDVLAYAETVTDLSKVRLGLPFYGYSWLRGRPPATSVTWAAARRLIDSFELEVMREHTEGRIDLDVRGLPDQTIYFVDAASITQRLSLVHEQFPTLGGLAIWGLGGEDPANWDVLREYEDSSCALRDV